MANLYNNNNLNLYSHKAILSALLVIVYAITIVHSLQTVSSNVTLGDIQKIDRANNENGNVQIINNNTLNNLNNNNLNSDASTASQRPIKKEPKHKTWTQSDSYEWSSTSDGIREETIDSNGRKRIKTKLINYIQAPNAALADRLPIQQAQFKFNPPTTPIVVNQQQSAPEAPTAIQVNTDRQGVTQSPKAPLDSLPLNDSNNNVTVSVDRNQFNYQQVNPLEVRSQFPFDGVPLAYKQTPVFVSTTMRSLEPAKNRLPQANEITNNHRNAITTYNFPNSDMRVHIGDEAADNDDDQPSALRAQLDDAIFDTMSSHVNNEVKGQNIAQLSSQGRVMNGQQPNQQMLGENQLKLNLNNIIRQMTQGNQAQPNQAQSVPRRAEQDSQQLGQSGQASSLHYRAPSQVQTKTTNSPWTIQRRLYVISYPHNLANSSLAQTNHSNDSLLTNQTLAPQTYRQPKQQLEARQPQTIVQVFEQTQHFTGSPNTHNTEDQNKRIYQYPSLATSTATGYEPLNLDQSNYKSDLFNLWN